MAAMDDCCYRCTECQTPVCQDRRCNNYDAGSGERLCSECLHDAVVVALSAS